MDLATNRDDAELRRLLASTPMPGVVTVSFRREPSFFEAAVVDGEFSQTVVARDCEEACIAGFGTRSVRQRYVNGVPTAIGYLSGLRLLPQYRNQGLLARGFRFFRQLHQDGRARVYLTTIANDNDIALDALTSGRTGLPRYHFAGVYHTAVIPLVRGKNCARVSELIEVRRAQEKDLPEVIRFLNTVGPSRQFIPCYETADLFTDDGTFRDLKPQDLLLAIRDGGVVGTLACWDQSGFRQTIVEGYQRTIAWTRPLYNGWATMRQQPRLPKPGETLSFLTGALALAQDDDQTVFSALLNEAISLGVGRRDYFLIGMHERDPLLRVIHERQVVDYHTNLYYVCWPDGETSRQQLDERPPYLELGCL